MVHILKLIRGLVKFAAVFISLAFLINGINGILSVTSLVDGQGISPDTINPEDFKIKYDDLHIEIGLKINNTGIYEIQDVVIGMKFFIRTNITDWNLVIDTNSTELNDTIPDSGDTIRPGEAKTIEIVADLPDFDLTPQEIATLFGIVDPNWDLADLLDVNFEVKMELTFTISYAFRQYQVAVALNMESADLEVGF